MANILNWRGKTTFSTGDTIAVHQTIEDKGKKRTQIFEGIVIRIRGHKGLKSFTVRKIGAGGIGVEKIFPEDTPTVTKIERKKTGKVRRAVLNYLRDRVGKKAKVKDVFIKKDKTQAEEPQIQEEQPKKKKLTEEERAAAKLAHKQKEAKTAVKERRKKKKPTKIVRKERKFVR